MTYNEIIENFISYLNIEKKYSYHTCLSYRNDLEQLFNYAIKQYEFCGINEIKHIHIRSWVAAMMSEGISPNSVNRKISALKSLYKWLLRKKLVDYNPMIKINSPKKIKRLPITVQDANINKLLDQNLSEVIDDSYSASRDRFIVELLYSTGIRRAELIGLKVSDINISREEVRVLGKGNKVRSIPITKSLEIAFELYMKSRNELELIESDFLLLTVKGKKLYPRIVHEIVSKKLQSITSLDKKSPHILRHSFATHMLDRGADLNAIKELLGHSNLAATQIYTQNSISKLKEVYAKAHPKSNE